MNSVKKSELPRKGLTVRELITELQALENQDVEVKLSTDSGFRCSTIGSIRSVGDQFVLISHLKEEDFLRAGWFL